MSASRLFLVDEQVLPAIYSKVVEAKTLLETGRAGSVSEAVRMTGISRTVFYKYRDHIAVWRRDSGDAAAFGVTLADSPGVLSAFIGRLSEFGADIMTINQSVPEGGTAGVDIVIRTGNLKEPPEELIPQLAAMDGVLEVKLLKINF